jgi:hypothetical protein
MALTQKEEGATYRREFFFLNNRERSWKRRRNLKKERCSHLNTKQM